MQSTWPVPFFYKIDWAPKSSLQRMTFNKPRVEGRSDLLVPVCEETLVSCAGLGRITSPASSSSAFSSRTGFRGDRGPLTLLLIDLLADKVHAVSALGVEAIMPGAVGAQKMLIVALKDRKGSLVLDLEAGSRAAAHPVGTRELALIA